MMRELREVLHEAFDRHARALGDSGADTAPVSALADIRRRRTRRSTLAVGGAAAACGAIAFAAIAVPGGAGDADDYGDGTLVAAPAPASGSPAWCYLEDYPAPNLDAFGPAGYAGRVYADYESSEFVFVSPEGEVQPMEQTEGGTYEAPGAGGRISIASGEDGEPMGPSVHMAMDYFDDGSGGGGAYLEDPDGPRLGYEWTTVAPEDVPAGINPKLLMEVHTLTLGFSGTGLEPAVAGADAVVESIIRYEDGTEEVVKIGRGEPGAGIQDYEGLESASIRATLPSGESYEITSHYDASQTYEAACGVTPPLLADDTREDLDPGPYDDLPEYIAGPYLEGPESSTFQCLATVPEDLIAEPTRLERQTGTYYDVEEAGIEFDFGEGGYVLAAPEDTFTGAEVPGPQYSGWGGGWSDDAGEVVGNVTYETLVWVDSDHRIIGRQQHEQAEDQERVTGHGDDDLSTMGGGPYGDRTWYIGDVSELAVPCEGIDAAELDEAELALIYGYGPSVDDMAWHVYFPERAAAEQED